ncbi:MAG: DUF4058 family protein [Planctomycetes bacterium]|nr:DUF4058 family protein [Planctomycetota bacterium]
MDPWLEHPNRWRDVHSSVVTYLRDDLHAILPRPYYARIEDRVIVDTEDVEVEEHYIEIRDLESGHKVVSVIEVISPTNKRPGGEGMRAYRAKQEELLASDTNLVEIDLLRGGQHVAAVPRDSLASLRPYHYLVVVRRAAEPDLRHVYPLRLDTRLPRVAIPLRDPDGDVVVDLQSLIDRAYERGAYAWTIDYQTPPEPPLEGPDAAWAAAQVGEG